MKASTGVAVACRLLRMLTFHAMKKMFTLTSLFLALWIHIPSLTAQDYLVDFTFLGTRTKFELLILFGQPVDYDIDLYKIRYKTPDVHGVLDTASGLIALPKTTPGTEFPIVVYAHGTTSGPTDVPSQLRGGFEAVMAYASKGFITAAPDYLGLGDSRGFHPYVHAASEASASFDMLNATVEYLESHEPEWDEHNLFIAGYSQGGHAGAALHKEIQDNWQFVYEVTGATHMSGPYSISGVMRDKFLSDDSYGYPAYIAYTSMGYQEAYGDLYTDIHGFFKEPYVTNILNFRNGTINLTTLNSQLVSLLSTNGDTVAKRMLQDSILDQITNDPDSKLNVYLKDNDRFNWAPQAPTRLYYCGGDKQVPFQNAIVADSAMNALGAPDTRAESRGASLDHGPCAFPSILSSIAFFQSLLISSTIEIYDKNPASIAVMPNPAIDIIKVNWEEATTGMEFQIMNVNGQVVRRGTSPSNSVDIHDLSSGIYMMLVSANHQTKLARFIHP